MFIRFRRCASQNGGPPMTVFVLYIFYLAWSKSPNHPHVKSKIETFPFLRSYPDDAEIYKITTLVISIGRKNISQFVYISKVGVRLAPLVIHDRDGILSRMVIDMADPLVRTRSNAHTSRQIVDECILISPILQFSSPNLWKHSITSLPLSRILVDFSLCGSERRQRPFSSIKLPKTEK